MTKKYTPTELGEQLSETAKRLSYDGEQDPRVRQAWAEHKRELDQQLWDLQHGRSDPP